MIHKLRKKFILINMMLVGAVLLVVFCAVCLSTHHRLREDSLNAMRQAVSYPFDEKFPHLEIGRKERRSKGKPMPMMPVFVVELAGDGSAASVRGKNVTVDPDAVAELVDAAQADGARSGRLPSYGLRYLIADNRDRTQIAFADTGSERQSMLNLLLTSLVVGICALGAFFAISVYLARWALRPAERAWQQQQQFVADASHELKTPLSVIMANTEIIASHQDETVASQMQWIENTRLEAKRMAELVADLLFLAKNDDGLKVQMEPVNISDCIETTVLSYDAVFYENGKSFRYDVVRDVKVIGNVGQIKQLTTILLDNANKYSVGDGNIFLNLTCAGRHITLSVSNDSEELSEEQISHLFDRFYTLDKSRNAEKSGNGLGLSIAKMISQTHGGDISASYSNGRTYFVVELPAYKSKKEQTNG